MDTSEASLLRAALDAAADGIVVAGLDGRFQFTNAPFRTMWLLTEDMCKDVDADRLLDYVECQLADPQGFRSRINEIYLEPAHTSFDVLAFKDGRIFERYSKPHTVVGRIVGRVWSYRNVSRRRRAERELEASQLRFTALTTATNDAVYDWDLVAGSIWWSDTFQQNFGFRPVVTATVADWWNEHTHPDDRARVEAGVRAALTGTAATWSSELRIRRADGSYATVSDRGCIQRDGQGRPTRMIGVLMDITAATEASERLGRLAAILESTTDYVGTADVTGRLQYLNRAARRLVGIAEDADVTALTLEDFHRGWASNTQVRSGIGQALRDGSWSGETAIRGPDGREVPVSHVILAHRDAGGEVSYLSTIARDMSGVRTLQQQLLQSQKMEAIGQLAGGIAHDFNNLLTVIKAHCEFLTEDIGVGHPLRADIDAVAAAGDRASSLTRQLLAFSRQQFLKPVSLDLNAVVNGLEPMLRRLIDEDVVFTTVCRDGLGVVHADQRQLEQVLLNLVVNARDAMPRGGKLTIATSAASIARDDNAVLGGALEPGDYCVLSVSDTGTGMPPGVRERIFEPFFTTKEQGKGTGLGLSTAYGIVKQSGGHMLVFTEVGHGSTFKVYLPRHDGVAVSRAPAAEQKPVSGRGVILLVEDEESLREAARRSLERAGYTLITASDGRHALRVANEAGPIDLLITDVVMPHLGGRELADLLRIDRPGLPVLFMSGYTDDDILRRGLLGDDGAFLEKPFTPQRLAAAARDVLASRSGA